MFYWWNSQHGTLKNKLRPTEIIRTSTTKSFVSKYVGYVKYINVDSFHIIGYVYIIKKTLHYIVCGQSKLKAEINGNRGKRETHSVLKRQITSDDNL